MIFKRPWQIFPLLAITLTFTVSEWARVWTGLKQWAFLEGLAISVPPVYLVITGVVWGVYGLIAVVLLWQGKTAARVMLISGAAAFGIFYWIEQLFLMVSPLRKVNWLFAILFTLLLVLFVPLTFRQPGVGEFYGGRHEQENQQ